jgi:sugar/nucleoside kinase (ribokinase family)
MLATKVLVIGSAHLDIVGEITGDVNNIDKIGKVHVSVGGSAFNVAASLAFHGINVVFASGVKSRSLGESAIRCELKKRKIDDTLLVSSSSLPESGFIAHTFRGDLISAVSETAVEHLRFTNSQLRSVIKKSDSVVIDANLGRDQIGQIETICRSFNRPLYASAVSETKVKRLDRLWKDRHAHFAAVVMNRAEATKCGFRFDLLATRNHLQEQICAHFSALTVVVTNGNEGYLVIERQGTNEVRLLNIQSGVYRKCVSTLGAGDALLASIVSMGQPPDWVAHRKIAKKYLDPVLATKGSTPAFNAPFL